MNGIPQILLATFALSAGSGADGNTAMPRSASNPMDTMPRTALARLEMARLRSGDSPPGVDPMLFRFPAELDSRGAFALAVLSGEVSSSGQSALRNVVATMQPSQLACRGAILPPFWDRLRECAPSDLDLIGRSRCLERSNRLYIAKQEELLAGESEVMRSTLAPALGDARARRIASFVTNWRRLDACWMFGSQHPTAAISPVDCLLDCIAGHKEADIDLGLFAPAVQVVQDESESLAASYREYRALACRAVAAARSMAALRPVTAEDPEQVRAAHQLSYREARARYVRAHRDAGDAAGRTASKHRLLCERLAAAMPPRESQELVWRYGHARYGSVVDCPWDPTALLNRLLAEAAVDPNVRDPIAAVSKSVGEGFRAAVIDMLDSYWLAVSRDHTTDSLVAESVRDRLRREQSVARERALALVLEARVAVGVGVPESWESTVSHWMDAGERSAVAQIAELVLWE